MMFHRAVALALIGLLFSGTGCTTSDKLSDEHQTVEILPKRHLPDDDTSASILWGIAVSEMDVNLQVQSTLKKLWQFGAVHLALSPDFPDAVLVMAR